MPFLAGLRRLAARAVKGAGFAFTGAKRTPLTEEASGLGAGFGRKGREIQKVCVRTMRFEPERAKNLFCMVMAKSGCFLRIAIISRHFAEIQID
jgi:hypothetical protein